MLGFSHHTSLREYFLHSFRSIIHHQSQPQKYGHLVSCGVTLLRHRSPLPFAHSNGPSRKWSRPVGPIQPRVRQTNRSQSYRPEVGRAIYPLEYKNFCFADERKTQGSLFSYRRGFPPINAGGKLLLWGGRYNPSRPKGGQVLGSDRSTARVLSPSNFLPRGLLSQQIKHGRSRFQGAGCPMRSLDPRRWRFWIRYCSVRKNMARI